MLVSDFQPYYKLLYHYNISIVLIRLRGFHKSSSMFQFMFLFQFADQVHIYFIFMNTFMSGCWFVYLVLEMQYLARMSIVFTTLPKNLFPKMISFILRFNNISGQWVFIILSRCLKNTFIIGQLYKINASKAILYYYKKSMNHYLLCSFF